MNELTGGVGGTEIATCTSVGVRVTGRCRSALARPRDGGRVLEEEQLGRTTHRHRAVEGVGTGSGSPETLFAE
jgi:hypothetical protein